MLKVSYKGYDIEVETLTSFGRYTTVVIDDFGEIKLDFAAPLYALDLAKAAIDMRLAARAELRSAVTLGA